VKKWLLGLIIVGVVCFGGSSAYADSSLRIQPLQYEESLQKGEHKKGFVDVSNPLPQSTKVMFSVEGFRQIDNKGNLTFYTDDQLRQGIQLDYDTFEIPAKKTLRLYFIIDGTKLPSGDVFAAIFAQTVADANVTALPSVRVGSLLILTNGTPAARDAAVVQLTTPLLQIGPTLNGQISIKNTASPQTSNGFFPHVTIRLWPFGPQYDIKGSFVYAGNTREVAFHEANSMFGVYKVSVTVGASHKERWVLLITGMWRWIVPALVVVAVASVMIAYRHRHSHQPR
jgi:hypothetical protein